jgi:hypothetical protein
MCNPDSLGLPESLDQSQRGVVFFRGQDIGLEDQKILGRKLGEVSHRIPGGTAADPSSLASPRSRDDASLTHCKLDMYGRWLVRLTKDRKVFDLFVIVDDLGQLGSLWREFLSDDRGWLEVLEDIEWVVSTQGMGGATQSKRTDSLGDYSHYPQHLINAFGLTRTPNLSTL